MRAIHRWLMPVFVLLLLYWAGSGLVLQIYDMTDPTHDWAENAGVAFSDSAGGSALADDQPALAAMLASALTDARAALPGAVSQVEIRAAATGPEAVVVFGSARRQLVFNADGSLQPPAARASFGPPGPPGSASAHNRIKTWHRGNIVGRWGVWVAGLVGIGLVLLIGSGVWLYLQMRQQRMAIGRHGFFWR
jgi:uncharacterized iron-regulated membrane protein